MRTIIAGSRHLAYGTTIRCIEKTLWVNEITVVLSGRAKGPDTWGESWALAHNIPVEAYPANWKLYGRGAGYFRNETMARKANALIAIWDGLSSGTENMIKLATRQGLRIVTWKFVNGLDKFYDPTYIDP